MVIESPYRYVSLKSGGFGCEGIVSIFCDYDLNKAF